MPDSIAVFNPIISPRVSSRARQNHQDQPGYQSELRLGIESPPTEMGSLREDNSCR